MGIEIYGRRPTAKAGERFQVSLAAWAAIHHLMGRLRGVETYAALRFADGAGPADSRPCRALANSLEKWLNKHPEGHVADVGLWQTPGGAVLSPYELTHPSDHVRESLVPACRVNADELREWIEFLRHCGGFEVWRTAAQAPERIQKRRRAAVAGDAGRE